MAENGRVTSELLWRLTVIMVMVDTPILLLIAGKVSSELFRKLKRYLVGAAFVVYAALWGTFASVFYWDEAYKAIFPTWSRWLLPAGYGVLYASLALAFWNISIFINKWKVVWFIVLGGLVSLIGHGIGISRGLLRVPLLAEASAASALGFGVFEFILYWCLIVGLAVAGRWLVLRTWRKQG